MYFDPIAAHERVEQRRIQVGEMISRYILPNEGEVGWDALKSCFLTYGDSQDPPSAEGEKFDIATSSWREINKMCLQIPEWQQVQSASNTRELYHCPHDTMKRIESIVSKLGCGGRRRPLLQTKDY